MRRGHWQTPDLLEILPLVDAIEVFNARCMSADYNKQAQNFAQKHEVEGTVGSDAHSAFEIGRAAMILPEFKDADSLKEVLPKAQFETTLSSPLVHFTSRYAVWYKMLFHPHIP